MNRAQRHWVERFTSQSFREKKRWDAALAAEHPGAKLVLCPDPAPSDALNQGAMPGFWHIAIDGDVLPLQDASGLPRDPGRWMFALLP